MTEAEKCDAMVAGFKKMGPDLGMKSKLSEVGVNHNSLPMLAEDAMKQQKAVGQQSTRDDL